MLAQRASAAVAGPLVSAIHIRKPPIARFKYFCDLFCFVALVKIGLLNLFQSHMAVEVLLLKIVPTLTLQQQLYQELVH